MYKQVAILLVVFIVAVSGCTGKFEVDLDVDQIKELFSDSGATTNGTDVWFIDAGQGDATLIESDGHYMLIDTGDSDAESTVLNFLADKGVTKLDYVVLTHAHADHIANFVEISQEYPIDMVLDSGSEIVTSKTYEATLEQISSSGITYATPKAGYTFEMGDADFTVLSPYDDTQVDEANDESIVLQMDVGSTRYLFMSDAEAANEAAILDAGYDVDADIIKVGHHGSDSSSSEPWIEAVTPELSVISVGKMNPYGHPDYEVISGLAEFGNVLRTDQRGTITVSTDGSTWEYVSEK